MLTDPAESSEFLRTQMDAEAQAGDEQQNVEAKESFWKALNTLPDEYRTVILLHQQMDLSFPEVAERMLSSTEAVQTLWSHAIVDLGQKLEERES